MKKIILIILDGMGDTAEFLDSCNLQNMNELIKNGKLLKLNVYNDIIPPQSDKAMVSLFGYDIKNNYCNRGPLEALGANLINVNDTNFLALRANFMTIENKDNIWEADIIDRRAGRTITKKEASGLSKAINEIQLDFDFKFQPTIGHRGVLVIRGFFKNASDIDSAYSHSSNKLQKSNNNILNSFIEQTHKILKEHPINKKRIENGLMPANAIGTRDAGTSLINLNIGKNWKACIGMPLEIGIAKLAEMNIRKTRYHGIKSGSIYPQIFKNLELEISSSLECLKSSSNNNWWHLKQFDIFGHDKKPEEKRKALELVDRKLISKLLDLDHTIAITADHATPVSVGTHTFDPVPLIITGNEKDTHSKISDFESAKPLRGKDLLRYVHNNSSRD